MGINLTWVCKTHKKHHTSMRGEESEDFQDMVRMADCPGPCLRNGNVTAWHDGYVPFDYTEYEEVYPNWNNRPAVRKT